MPTRHLIDPELLAGLDLMPNLVFSPEALPLIRAAVNESVAGQPIPAGLPVDVEILNISGGDGQPMQIRVYRPREAARPAPGVLQMHGGGFVMGTAAMGDPLYRVIAASL